MNSFEYLIKKTDKESLIYDDLVNIIELIDKTTINKDNISLILKLISNLTIYYKFIDFPDIDKIYEKNKDFLSNGDIISLVKIFCSFGYNNPCKAIELIILYNVHKTSSYLPLFQFLIETNNYIIIKELFNILIKQNKIIIDHNQEIKEYNQKIKHYNAQIKLLKQKYNEFNSILHVIKEIDNDYNVSISNIDFNDKQFKTEQNLIIIDNNIILNIIQIAIKNLDTDFIQYILLHFYSLNLDIISLLTTYFVKHTITTINQSNNCSCCNKHLELNIIQNNRNNILTILENKILTITNRNDNGLIIDKKHLQNIKNKFDELNVLLNKYDFNIIIDGGNLGLFHSKNNELNLQFMKNAINKILNKTNKYTLLICHERHINKIKQLNIKNEFLIIYFSPTCIDDDLFWLYASIYSKAYIYSNDLSRNNSCIIAYQYEIKSWLNHYQIKINNDLTLPDEINKYTIINFFVENHIIVNNSLVYCI